MNHCPLKTNWLSTKLHPAMLLLVWIAIYSTSNTPTFADEPHTKALEYNRDIRPILTEYCFACHGKDSASRQADLRLDQREDAIDFGAIAPNSPDDSELIARIFSDDPDLVMPPPEIKKVMTAEQKELLTRWIASGAEYQPHWSFLKPVTHEPPAAENKAWNQTAIDRFVFARLQEKGLSPAPAADARTLFRRLHFDITGLPPLTADVTAFVTDFEKNQDVALSKWIDRLMESSAWGEHRGRYWLDAARYADTHGLHFDNYREMWPYRDWVIRAFNANQPFDQFVVEQLAGDLLPNPTTEQLVATGFQRCNVTTNEGGTIPEENLANYASDHVQTFGWVFLGLTTNCAQCHDHKFDPISTRDYYALAAFFRNTQSPALDGNIKDGKGPTLVVPTRTDQARWKDLPAEITSATEKRDERKTKAADAFKTWLTNAKPTVITDSLNAGLVTHVPLNEGNGNEVTALIGAPNQFKAEGPLAWKPDGKLGPAPIIKAGSTLNLGNQGDLEKDQAFSFGVWVKNTAATAKSGGYSLLARMDNNNGHRGWDLWQSGGRFATHLVDQWPDNSIKVVTKKNVVATDKWQHVFITYSGSGSPDGIKIYVDGISKPLSTAKNTLKKEASFRTQVSLRVGQRDTDAIFGGGQIQDVRIYSRELSTDEVNTLSQLPKLQSLLTKATNALGPKEQKPLLNFYLQNIDSEHILLSNAVTTLKAERQTIKTRSPITHIQKEKTDSMPMAHIQLRGAYDQLGEKVKAAPPAFLHAMPADKPNNRLGLAYWVVDPANPLMSRVTVNRFWQEVFGQGLVTTAEDFGIAGSLPSHPKLLDWLANDFVEQGWDVKRLYKQIFMSATYRQSALTSAKKIGLDPSNTFFSHGPRFRMDAEMVRDSSLAVSGLLSAKQFGPGTRPYQPGNIWDIVGMAGSDTRNYKQDQGEGLYRRTIYNFWKRMAPPPNMEAFNAPSREMCTVQRERTNTPLQALVTLNDPQFVEAARRLAENAMRTNQGNDESTLDYIANQVLARPLTSAERVLVLAAKSDYLAHYNQNETDAKALIAIGATKPEEKLNAATLAAWSMVCNQFLNLDEALNK